MTDKREVAELLGEHFASISDTCQNNPTFACCNAEVECRLLKMDGGEAEPYNSPFLPSKFHNALRLSTDGSPGDDQLTYSMVKLAHPTMQRMILSIQNTINSSNTFPEQW